MPILLSDKDNNKYKKCIFCIIKKININKRSASFMSRIVYFIKICRRRRKEEMVHITFGYLKQMIITA